MPDRNLSLTRLHVLDVLGCDACGRQLISGQRYEQLLDVSCMALGLAFMGKYIACPRGFLCLYGGSIMLGRRWC